MSDLSIQGDNRFSSIWVRAEFWIKGKLLLRYKADGAYFELDPCLNSSIMPCNVSCLNKNILVDYWLDFPMNKAPCKQLISVSLPFYWNASARDLNFLDWEVTELTLIHLNSSLPL